MFTNLNFIFIIGAPGRGVINKNKIRRAGQTT